MAERIHIYHISRGYVRCEVATGDAKSKQRIGTSVITPDKGLTHQQRREIVSNWLRERFKIQIRTNPTMDTKELKQACERAASAGFTAHVSTNSVYFAEFNRLATPTVVLALIKEVERLTEQWNTRFNTLCGNCGKRYRGPRDDGLHGSGICNVPQQKESHG